MKFQFLEEFKLNKATKTQINKLLTVCFPETDYEGRTYFKQLSHYRLLLWAANELIAQFGLDYRVRTLGGLPIRVLEVIDLAVHLTHQKRGYGTAPLGELDSIAKQFKHNIDFLFLVADKHRFYEKSGFQLTKQRVRWLTLRITSIMKFKRIHSTIV